MEPQSRPNDDQTQYQAQYWNGPEANHWLVHEHRYERMGASFTRLVLDAAAVARADRVLDIGCGTGSTTCTAARAADDGQALGVDIARPLLQRAKQRARHDSLTNVRFEHGDAQTHRLAPQGFDVAISRFGVMFFSDPTAAFANIARGLRPGGRIAFVCWQPMANNEWITVLSAAAAAQHIPCRRPTNPAVADRSRWATSSTWRPSWTLPGSSTSPSNRSWSRCGWVETWPTPSNSSKRAGSANGCSKTPTPQRAGGSRRRCRPRWSPI